MDAGLIPVKRLDSAKARLGPGFDQDARLRIATALLADALALCASADFLEWWIVTDDPEVSSRARDQRIEVLSDPGNGLNAALTLGARAVAERGASSITIVPADVPLALASDIEDIVDTGVTSQMVVVPSERDGGTNGLYLRPPDLTPPQFGPASLQAHLDSAQARGIRCSILRLPRLALDLDTDTDVDAILELSRSGRTVDLLRALRAEA
jgi:2-phospho-L-lactate guanylyltransferase